MSAGCCPKEKHHETDSSLKRIVIVGSPNVGKSLLFNHLTGRYVTVANYPGTTVEVSKGKAVIEGAAYQIVDTPGMYSLSPLSEEESVARKILFEEKPALVIHLVDAKNLERMLPLTLQLIEAGLPTLLVLNMMDEARALRIGINRKALSRRLGTPVLETVLTTGIGMKGVREAIRQFSERTPEGDPSASQAFEKSKTESHDYLELETAMAFRRSAREITEKVWRRKSPWSSSLSLHRMGEVLSRLTMNPLTGFPILFFVLYWGLYQFVGVFGAGTVVDFLETKVFEEFLNPYFIRIFTKLIPWPVFRDLFVGDYGVLTLGVRYAVALILPIVSFYFAVFAVIEDTGYLPRLAMLLDRTFKKIGLSGRAVIPMVLGFGCDTMATMVTRTLPTVRERIISTLLLSLAIPCSAQLGVIMAVLSGHRLALLLWAGVVGLVFLFIGFLTAQILPGERPSFYMELPPLRWPKISHVLTKTYVRVKWYFTEVLPLFIVASALIWLGQLTGLFNLVIRALAVPVRTIGLPAEAASIFLMGFFRRDYGAAGLYDLVEKGALTGVQVLVACVALTLFLPCIAQFLMNVKERGWKTGAAISVFILFFSFGAAYVLNAALLGLGVKL